MNNAEKSKYLFANLNWKDLAASQQKGNLVLLLPIGSTESHGPHAPLSTDALISSEVCLRSARVRLPSAFQRGETHADRYETSAIMAIDPSLINEDRRKALPCLPISLVDKLFKEKLSDFLEFGMMESYCGDPASATTEEGELVLMRKWSVKFPWINIRC